jgi:hypothetical protein
MVRKECLSSGQWIQFHRLSLKVPNRFTTISPESSQFYWSLKSRLFFEHSRAQLSGNIGFPPICGNFVLIEFQFTSFHELDIHKTLYAVTPPNTFSEVARQQNLPLLLRPLRYFSTSQTSVASQALHFEQHFPLCLSNFCSTMLIKRTCSFYGGRFAFKKDTQCLPQSSLEQY